MRGPSARTSDPILTGLRDHITLCTEAQWDGDLLSRDDAVAQLTVTYEPEENSIWLEHIEATGGTGLGSQIVCAIRCFCIENTTELYVGPVTNPGYWAKQHPWLQLAPFDLHGDPVLRYDPRPAPVVDRRRDRGAEPDAERTARNEADAIGRLASWRAEEEIDADWALVYWDTWPPQQPSRRLFITDPTSRELVAERVFIVQCTRSSDACDAGDWISALLSADGVSVATCG